ncbi:hypothetical protein Nepgr_000227 [Nepenthes gracilis]|uniref:Uncharacterized protein n=1 Tax=Nepenthes gracilis TaxID=150966 RepID=A0AAD3P4X2_NEPGR|nr:hypothetical protein Nepgr_000227 [Nepenthes gracilis]
MTGKIVIKSAPSVNRRQLLLSSNSLASPSREKSTVAEVAGGTAAECVAICCCCPCLLIGCLILTIYKVPTGICRRMLRKHHQKRLLKKQGLLHHQTSRSISCFDELPEADDLKVFEMIKISIDGSAEAIDLDNKMWEQFHNTGFWRSSSQRHVL